MSTETREAPVDLSGHYAGQIIEVSATMRAEGHYYRDGRDIHGTPVYRWEADRWQATRRTVDTSCAPGDPLRVAEESSPWCASRDAAEDWLEGAGLLLGGAYWHGARVIADAAQGGGE